MVAPSKKIKMYQNLMLSFRYNLDYRIRKNDFRAFIKRFRLPNISQVNHSTHGRFERKKNI